MKPENICGSTRLVVTFNATLVYFTIYLIRVQFSIAILCIIKDGPIRTVNYTVNEAIYDGTYVALRNESSGRRIKSHPHDIIDGLHATFEYTTSRADILNKRNGHLLPTNVTYHSTNNETVQDDETLHRTSADNEENFHWDKSLQGLMLTAFFWGYIITQIPCGWLAVRFGSRHLISLCLFISNTANVLTPFATKLDPHFAICLRFIIGFAQGGMLPAMTSLFGCWAPPLERSILLGPFNAGGVIANCLALGLTGLICSAFGWESIFYIYGVVSYLSLVLWCYNVYSTPDSHPRISKKEKTMIQDALGESTKIKRVRIPWRRICTSGPVWAIIVAHFCDNWGTYTIITTAPLFMKEVFKFDIKTNSLLVALPYLVMFPVILISSQVADWLRRNRILSSTRVRKLYQAIGFIVPAISLVALGFVTYLQRALAVTLLTIAVAFQAFGLSAYNINFVDIAPRFSGLLYGISNTIATIPGMVAPYIATKLTPNGTQEEWQLVFFICSALFILGMLVYVVFASGEEQKWAKLATCNTIVELNIAPVEAAISNGEKDALTG